MGTSLPRPDATDSTLSATGIAGLDEILFGGLTAGYVHLVEGDPGTGKTTVGMQFIQEGLRRGESSLYVTFSETQRELLSSLRSHGWTAEPPILEIVPGPDAFEESKRYTIFHPGEVEIAPMVKRLCDEIERLNPTRLVLDSLTEIRLLSGDAVRYRRELLALQQFLAARNPTPTVLLLDDRTSVSDGHGTLMLHSLAHGVIRLETIKRSYGTTRRRLEIVKMRGAGYREGFHDYAIRRGGVTVYPRPTIAKSEVPDRRPVAFVRSGLGELDTLFGGGLDPGSSTLIVGPTGSGKSSIALLYAMAAAQRGERTAYYNFDETTDTMKKRARGFGMDIDSEVQKGTLCLEQVDPAELSPGEFASRIQHEVLKGNARMVVLDSLNGYLNAMPGETDLVLQVHELLTVLSGEGVSTLVILTQHGFLGSLETPVDVSYLADNLLLLRFFEAGGSVRHAISTMKKRTGPHERTIRELRFGPGGVEIGAPLVQFRGVLNGVPDYVGSKGSLEEASDDHT